MGQLEPVLLSAQCDHGIGKFETAAAAFDSAILLTQTAIVVMLTILVMVLLFRRLGLFGKGGFLWRKPLLLPSFAFIFAVMMSLSVAGLQISDYRGYNSLYTHEYPDDIGTITVYGGPAYVTTLELVIDGGFIADSSLNVIVSLWQNFTYVTGATLSSGYVTESREVYEKTPFSAPEGVYQVTFNMTYVESGSPLESGPSAHVYLSQVLADGHIQEILNWETYRLGIVAVGLVLLVAGVCYDTGTGSVQKSDDAKG